MGDHKRSIPPLPGSQRSWEYLQQGDSHLFTIDPYQSHFSTTPSPLSMNQATHETRHSPFLGPSQLTFVGYPESSQRASLDLQTTVVYEQTGKPRQPFKHDSSLGYHYDYFPIENGRSALLPGSGTSSHVGTSNSSDYILPFTWNTDHIDQFSTYHQPRLETSSSFHVPVLPPDVLSPFTDGYQPEPMPKMLTSQTPPFLHHLQPIEPPTVNYGIPSGAMESDYPRASQTIPSVREPDIPFTQNALRNLPEDAGGSSMTVNSHDSGWPILANSTHYSYPLSMDHTPSPTLHASESEASTSTAVSEVSAGFSSCSTPSQPDISNDGPNLNRRPKKKSKMHECEICHKLFPRPSGLQTHMNTHTDSKPFPCSVPGCMKRFAVRSNAKRHLRTHGIVPSSTSEREQAPYVVGFSPPVVLQPDQQEHHQMSRVPLKLQWIPNSLVSRANASSLVSCPDSDMEDGPEDVEEPSTTSLSPVLPMPLRSVVPSVLSGLDDPEEYYEERNSYLEAGSHPYHQSQYRGLPGPAPALPKAHKTVHE